MSIDRKKVLKGLEACELYGQTLQYCLEQECPYVEQRGKTGECVRLLHEDAREALEETWRQVAAATKAPRVLTLEEVLEHKPFVLWAEDMETGAQPFQVALVDGVYRDYAFDWAINTESKNKKVFDDYGKIWRFWDRKPTNEEREATPWTS